MTRKDLDRVLYCARAILLLLFIVIAECIIYILLMLFSDYNNEMLAAQYSVEKEVELVND